tara:strand:+ start:109 stop:2310 length:2202 start_codon:yes stop_codon:yes gene_type:complete
MSLGGAYTDFTNFLRNIGRVYGDISLTGQIYRGVGSLFQPPPGDMLRLPNALGGGFHPSFIQGIPLPPGAENNPSPLPQDPVSQFEDTVVGRFHRPFDKPIVTPPPQNTSTVDPTFDFAEGGEVAPTLSFLEEERPVEQTMTPEEQYGVIKAPDSPLMAKAAEIFRGVERRVAGSPAEFMLPGGGIATVLERKAYGEDPSALEYGFAALDTTDVLPLGKMAIFAGAASASGVKKIRELIEREQMGQTPDQIFAETDTFRSPLHGRPQFEIDDTGAKLREDSDIFNANRPVMRTREGYRFSEEDIVGRTDVESGFGRVIEPGETFNATERSSQVYSPFIAKNLSRERVSFESKGMQYLEEILDHPELYREYPTAKRIKVEEVPLNFRDRSQVNGLFDPVTETIYINSSNLEGKPELIVPKLFHELQHWVQDQEGFPAGDSVRDIPENLVQKMQTLRQEFVNLENQTASFLKPIVKSAFKSVGELTEAQKSLSRLKTSSEAIEQQSKRLAQKLRFFYADYTDALAKGRQSGTFADFIRENAKPGDFGVLDELKSGAGPTDAISDFSRVVTKSGRESTLDALGPLFKRMDNLGEEGFELSYQARLQGERAFQDYSSTAGEYEARIVEESSKEAGRIPPTPAQRLEEERDRMLVRAERQAIKNKENPYTTTTRPENIRFAERFPPTSEVFDDFGNVRVPEQKAAGGGVGSLAPVARNMFNGSDIKRGVGAYIPYTRR